MTGRKQNRNLKRGGITTDEASKMGRKGGKASGVARREKKAMIKTLDIILSMPLKDGDLADIDKLRNLNETLDKNISVQEGIIIAQTLKALRGDTKAAGWIISTIQSAQDKTTPTETPITIIDDFA